MKEISLNGKIIKTEVRTAFGLRENNKSIIILNGFGINDDTDLKDGDVLFVFDKDHNLTDDERRMLLSARDSPELCEVMSGSIIGIAGLGGLGSNIAEMLTRSGIGKLIVADMDIVDATNLNRQNYFVEDIGQSKTEATAKILKMIDPYIDITAYHCRLTENNICSIFKDCDIVCECLDDPEEKAMFINTVLEKCPEKTIISGSGMAGCDHSNLIKTEKRFNGLYICGDGVNEARQGMGLMSPCVNICAGHMANAVIRKLMGLDI